MEVSRALPGALQLVEPEHARRDAGQGRTDPEVILALGDVGAGVKGRLPVTKWFDLALHLGLRFFNSVSGVSVLGSATNFAPDLIGVVRSAPRRGHGEGAAALPPQLRLRRRQLDRSLARRAVRDARPATTPASARASSRPSPTASTRAASSSPPPSTRRWRSPATRSGSTSSSSITSTSPSVTATRSWRNAVRSAFPASQQADRVDGNSQQYLTFGARVRPVAGLVLDAGLDVGLSSYGFRYGSPLPTWNVLLGAAYAYDPGAGRGRTKVVTKTITREILRGAVEGKLRGFVRDAATKKPIGGATISTRRGARRRSSAPTTAASSATASRRGRCRSRSRATTTRAAKIDTSVGGQRRDAARGAADGEAAGGDRRARQGRRRRRHAGRHGDGAR